jgi:hypothetical protein
MITAVPSFTLERACVAGDAAGWRGVLHRADAPQLSVQFFIAEDGPTPPDILDGLAIAFLPLVMRAGGSLHVRGPLTRGALRNLTEYSESWANWRPAAFHRVTITADEIVDLPRLSVPDEALVAWSGGLRSTYTLVRHRDRLIPGAFGVRAAVRVVGLDREAGDAAADDAGGDAVAALGAEGIGAITVRTDARRQGLIDREIGGLPIVAAALHAVSGAGTIGLHARRWHFGAQLRFPRPGPALADLLSGDAFAVRADGGAASPALMAEAVGRHEALAAVLSDCRRSRPGPPCGTCPECTLLALAFAARGLPCPRSRLRISVPAVARLPFGDPVVAADAIATLRDWSSDRSGWQTLLRARVGLNRLAVDVRDHFRWAGAVAGLLAPWPR